MAGNLQLRAAEALRLKNPKRTSRVNPNPSRNATTTPVQGSGTGKAKGVGTQGACKTHQAQGFEE